MAFEDFYRLSSHAVITNEENKILLVKATYGNKIWSFPGGSLDPDETIHEALYRECKEELDVNVEILYLSGIYYHKSYNAHTCIFRCKIIDPQRPIKLSAEHSAFGYFALDELGPVQKHRATDCLNFDGVVKSAKFL